MKSSTSELGLIFLTHLFSILQTIVDDINNGIDGTKVKPGIIGEVGCSWPLAEVERRSLRAAATAQSQTKTPVMIHPGRDPTAPFENLRIFQEAGGDAKHTVIAHLGRTISKKDTLLELAETGMYIYINGYLKQEGWVEELFSENTTKSAGSLPLTFWKDSLLTVHVLNQ